MNPLSVVEFHGWEFSVDVAARDAAYAATNRHGARDCTCEPCQNFVAQRDREYPEELLQFLRACGIEPLLAAEVSWIDPLDSGPIWYHGWWHFAGSITAIGDKRIELPVNPGCTRAEWTLDFPTGTHLQLETFSETSLLIQIEFTVTLPWVLDEPMTS